MKAFITNLKIIFTAKEKARASLKGRAFLFEIPNLKKVNVQCQNHPSQSYLSQR